MRPTLALVRGVVTSLLLAAAAACTTPPASGTVACADDSACPAQFPRCSATAPGGQCVCVAAGEAAAAVSAVSVLGVQGSPRGAVVRGTVLVDVSATSSAGVKAVTLAAAGASTTYPLQRSADGVFTFTVDTTATADGVHSLVATLTPNDGSADVKSAAFSLATDNTAPVLTVVGLVPAEARAGSLVVLSLTSSEPLGHLGGTVSTGGAAVGPMLASPSATTSTLSFLVPATAVSGAYTVAVEATDVAGNPAAALTAPRFTVRAGFALTSLTVTGNAVVGGVPAGALGTALTASFTLPDAVDTGATTPTFTLVDALGHRRAFAATPTSTVAAGTRTWTVTDAITAADASGAATLEARLGDPSGNTASAVAVLLIDKDAPVLASLAAASAVVDTGSLTQHLTATATEGLATATVVTSNGDVGTCDLTAPPALSCGVTLSHDPATPTAAVTATVTVTDLVGNRASFPVGYTVAALPVATSLTAADAAITLGRSTLLTAVFANGSGAVNGVPVASGQPLLVAPSTTTTYTLVVTNAAGHTASATPAPVTVVGAPAITSFTAAASTVTAGAATTLTAVFTGGVGTVSPALGPVTSGTAVSTGPISAATTYTLSVVNAAGVTVTASVLVTVADAAGASLTIENLGSPATITQGSAVNLVPVCGTGQAGSLDQGIGAIVSHLRVPVTPGAGSTTYTLTCTGGASSASATVTLTTVAAPVLTSFTSVAPALTAGQSATLSFVFSGGTGDVNGTPVTSGVDLVVSPSATTGYTLTVKNAATPQAVQTRALSVQVVPAPVATSLVAAASPLAAGQGTTLTPTFSGGFAVVDQGFGAVSSGQAYPVQPATSTTYTLTVTNSLGAVATATATVAVDPAPQISSFAAARTAIEVGQSTTLTGVFSGGTGALTPGALAVTSGAATSVSPAATQTYTLTVTGTNGAVTSLGATVTVVPPLDASDALVASVGGCTVGSTATVTPHFAAGETATFNGTPVQDGQALTVSPSLGTNTYSLVLTNAAGSTQTRTVTISGVAMPVISAFAASAPAVTATQPSTLSFAFTGGLGDVNGNAVTSGVDLVVNPTTTTTYVLTVKNAGTPQGVVTRAVTVQVTPMPVVTSLVASASTLAAGQSTVLTPVFAAGTGTITPGLGVVQSGQYCTVQPTVSTTYTLTVTNALGFAVTKTVLVTVVAAPLIFNFQTMSPVIELGQSTLLTGLFSGGTGQVTGAASFSIPGSGVNRAVTPGPGLGEYQYTLTVSGANGSTASATAKVLVVAPVDPTDSLTASAATVTDGDTATVTPHFAAAESGMINGFVVVNNQPLVVAPAPGTNTTYTLTVATQAGSTQTRTVTITSVPAPRINVFSASPSVVASTGAVSVAYDYAGGGAVLSASAGTPALTGLAGPAATGTQVFTAPATAVTQPVTYTLTVTNAAGRTATSGVQVSVVPPATASLTFSGGATATTIDPGGSVTLVANYQGTSATLNGLPVPTPSTTMTLNNIQRTTTYVLRAQDPTGASVTASVTATVNAKISAFSVSPSVVTTGVSTTLTFTGSHAGGGVDGNGAGTVTPGPLSLAAGADAQVATTGPLTAGAHVYTLTVLNSAGTPATATATVTAVAAPVATSLVPSVTTLTLGDTVALLPTFSAPAGGSAWLVDGLGSVVASALTSGTAVRVAPSALGPIAYTLVVTNGATGASATASVAAPVITVVAPPAMPSITVAAAMTAGAGASATTVARAGFSYLWTLSGGGVGGATVIVAGVSTFSFTAGASPGAITITCAEVNLAGTSSPRAAATVSVYAAPQSRSISVPVFVTAGTSGNVASVVASPGMTYTWVAGGAGLPLLTNANGPAGVTANGRNAVTFTASGSAGTVATFVVTETNPAGASSASPTASVSLVAPVLAPVVTAPASVTVGVPGYQATTASVAGTTIQWTIDNGSITAGATSTTVTFTATSAGPVTLTATRTNQAGAFNTGSASVTAVAAPAISAFTVSQNVVTNGASPTFSFTSNDVAASVQVNRAGTGCAAGSSTIPLVAGSGSLAIATALTAAYAASATEATCTVTATLTNSVGTTATASLFVTVVPAPAGTLSAPASVASGTDVSVSVTAAPWSVNGSTLTLNGQPVIYNGGVAVALLFSNVTKSTLWNLTVTNRAGTSATITGTTVVAPVITDFGAGASQPVASSSARVALGSSTTLFASFGGSGASGNAPGVVTCAGAACASPSVGTLASGGALSTGLFTTAGTATYTLTVTGSSGATTAATATVTAVPPPVGVSLGASASTANRGTAVSLTPTFSLPFGGTATLSGTDGFSAPAVSGQVVSATSFSPAASVTYTLTVDNGVSAPVTVTRTVALYTGAWSVLSTLPQARSGVTVTPILVGSPATKGAVLVAGGLDSGGAPTNSVLVCTATGSCLPPQGAGTVMSVPRAYHTATALTAGPLAGQIALLGGFTDVGLATPTATVDLYDPVLDTLTAGPALTVAVAHHAATLLPDGLTVLVAGGLINATTPTTTLVEYVPSTGAKTPYAMAVARADLTASLLNATTVLLVGGSAGTAAFERFNPTTKAVTSPGVLPVLGLRQHTATWLPTVGATGTLLLAGGLPATGVEASALYLYDLSTNVVTTSPATLAQARTRHAAMLVPGTSTVLICGGLQGATALSSCENYLGATNAVAPTAAMAVARRDFGLAPLTIAGLTELLAVGGPSTTVLAEYFDWR